MEPFARYFAPHARRFDFVEQIIYLFGTCPILHEAKNLWEIAEVLIVDFGLVRNTTRVPIEQKHT